MVSGDLNDLLTSQQDVAAALDMSTATLERYLARYPWRGADLPPGKVNGRWRVKRSDVLDWFEYVRRQQVRHPEARRFRPEEAPEVAAIRGRGKN